MFDEVKSKLFGSSDPTHPLDKDKDEHLVKKREAEQELSDLRNRRDSLKEKLNKKRSHYEKQKSTGDDEHAKDLLRDAEEIKKELETVRGRIDEISKQRNLASNMANLMEVSKGQDDEYWNSLREMDQEEIIKVFEKQQMQTEELHTALGETGKLSDNLLDTYQSGSEELHADSSLEKEWSESKEKEKAEEIFGDIDTDFENATEEKGTDDETMELT